MRRRPTTCAQSSESSRPLTGRAVVDAPNRAGRRPRAKEADVSLFFWLRSALCATVHSALPLSKLSDSGEVSMPNPY